MIFPNAKRLDAIVIAETVKRLESNAPLDDAEANMHAIVTYPGREERLLERAAFLGQRLGLPLVLQRWRSRAGMVWIGLALLVFLTGFGMVKVLLGGDRAINVVLAFIAALGIHVLVLVFWLLSLISTYVRPRAGPSRFSLGNLSLKMMTWPPSRQHQSATHMLPAALQVLERGKLLPWAFGLVSHAVWAAAFVLALLAMWFMFSFREYRLTWETTILDPAFFVRFVEVAGIVPHFLGFPVPDAARLLDPGGANHRLLAYWLMGCTFAYGLLPRLLLAILSLLAWRSGQRTLRLDTSDPYFRKLLARFDELERPLIIDPETRVAGAESGSIKREVAGKGAVLMGFELPPECDWRLLSAAAKASLALNVSGAGDQSEAALHTLRAAPPQRLLFVCDQAASPDRGTARFLRQASAFSQQCAILLLPVRDQGDSYVRRWSAWLGESGLESVAIFAERDQAIDWLGGAS